MPRFLLALLTVALLATACATPASLPTTVRPDPQQGPHAFLWEAKKGDATLFLVGSIHLGKRDVLALSPSMRRAFEASDALVVEVDSQNVDQERMKTLVMRGGSFPEGEAGLLERLEPADVALLRAAVAPAGLPLENLQRMKPWLVSIMLLTVELTAAGFDAQSGVDNQFLALAKGSKEVLELETMDMQLALFSDTPMPDQVLMLQQHLRSTGGEASKSLTSVSQAWAAGDADRIDRELLEDMRKPEYRSLYRRIFSDRNVQMVEKLDALASPTKKHFVVVGAGHVVGDDGLLALLRKRGYQVRQLPRE